MPELQSCEDCAARIRKYSFWGRNPLKVKVPPTGGAGKGTSNLTADISLLLTSNNSYSIEILNPRKHTGALPQGCDWTITPELSLLSKQVCPGPWSAPKFFGSRSIKIGFLILRMVGPQDGHPPFHVRRWVSDASIEAWNQFVILASSSSDRLLSDSMPAKTYRRMVSERDRRSVGNCLTARLAGSTATHSRVNV